MSVGSVSRVVSIALLLLIGGSGALVGSQLFGAVATIDAGGADGGARVIAGGVLGYGLLLVVAAVGLLTARGWAWALGSVTLVAGIVVLVALAATAGRDEILLGGVVIWGTALVSLAIARRYGTA